MSNYAFAYVAIYLICYHSAYLNRPTISNLVHHCIFWFFLWKKFIEVFRVKQTYIHRFLLTIIIRRFMIFDYIEFTSPQKSRTKIKYKRLVIVVLSICMQVKREEFPLIPTNHNKHRNCQSTRFKPAFLNIQYDQIVKL